MNINNIELNKIHESLWEIPKHGGMRVPGRIYISENMMQNSLQNDDALKQVINVAHLPGIQKFSLAMPDIHWGYGFPIGGVAATSVEDGVISPGGVGYDINCGVRIASTSLSLDEVQNRIPKLIENLFKKIPTGVGSSGAIKMLSKTDVKNILTKGSAWAVENEFGNKNDIEFTEESGCMKEAYVHSVSERAIERGLDQAGTLGSGNHFLEVGVVENIFNDAAAQTMGLFKNQIVVMIHTGSRGLGYQVCEDYLKILHRTSEKFGFDLPDKQLICAPLNSQEGKDYFTAMKCAANFAWNNRQIIMELARRAFKSTFSISDEELAFNLIYDVSHNIAKIEDHSIDGKLRKVCVHRKGATRAFPPGSSQIPRKYLEIGQPVLIPGDMGRYSFIAVGTAKAMDETFGSSCHGAGRIRSRNKALELGKHRDIISELRQRGIVVQAKGKKTLAEEMSYAYKDVKDVVDVMDSAGIINKVAKIKPLGVIKG
ncbi:MAG: RtcB family protein [Bacteroidetes bacterium]|nr:RtcB family protein [Bacteroidota bacterium]MBU1679467.1 RtcB family protein [Bacteroidota bacterium]